MCVRRFVLLRGDTSHASFYPIPVSGSGYYDTFSSYLDTFRVYLLCFYSTTPPLFLTLMIITVAAIHTLRQSLHQTTGAAEFSNVLSPLSCDRTKFAEAKRQCQD